MSKLHIFVFVSEIGELNQKTRNSLHRLSSHPIEVTWLEQQQLIHQYVPMCDYVCFLSAGDHLTESYLQAFLTLSTSLQYAYQPEWSYLFAKKGDIFYRLNLDITPHSHEVNRILLYPHHSKHIIFPKEVWGGCAERESGSPFFWQLAQMLVEQDIPIVTLPNCISIEYQNISILNNREDIHKGLIPEASQLFSRKMLISHQNFSDFTEEKT